MSLTAAQIARQIEMNEDELDALAGYLSGGKGSADQRAAWEGRRKTIAAAQISWSAQYRRLTGGYYAMAGGQLVPFAVANARVDADEKAETDAAAAKAAVAAARDELNQLIGYLDTDHHRLAGLVQSHLDNAFGQGVAIGILGTLSRQMGGTSTAVLIDLGFQLRKAGELIVKARQAYNRGNLALARQHAVQAAKDLTAVAGLLQAWVDKVMVGGERAEVAIKVTAAVTTAAFTGGASLSVLQGAGVAAVGEGAQQGTTLILKGVSDGDTVSARDLTNALLETVIAGGGSVVGAKGLPALGRIAGAVAPRLVERILAKAGSTVAANPRMITYVTKVLEQYLEANAKTLAKQLTMPGANVSFEWWENALTPALTGLTAGKLSSL